MADTDKQQERISLAEAWCLINGKEPPVRTEQEIAEFRAKLDAADEQARRIYGATAAE
jgi:cell division protein FtsB